MVLRQDQASIHVTLDLNKRCQTNATGFSLVSWDGRDRIRASCSSREILDAGDDTVHHWEFGFSPALRDRLWQCAARYDVLRSKRVYVLKALQCCLFKRRQSGWSTSVPAVLEPAVLCRGAEGGLSSPPSRSVAPPKPSFHFSFSALRRSFVQRHAAWHACSPCLTPPVLARSSMQQ